MTRNFLLPCKNCGTKIPITVSQAGEAIDCPNCQTSNQFPTLREVNRLEVAESIRPATPDRREQSRNAWRGGRGIALAVCLAIAILFLSRAAYYGYGRSTIDTRGSAEEMIASLNEIVDAKDSRELMADWIQSSKFSLTEEARDGKRPTFFYNQKAAAYVEKQIWISAIIGGIALAGLATTLLLWPKPKPQ
jgi:hypothetical protein